METSFQKIQKGTNCYILIVHWSHMTYIHFYSITRGINTVYAKHLTMRNHFLIECRDLACNRQCFFNSNNMKDLFENVNMDDILSFLGEIKL